MSLIAPFPYFGGKRAVTGDVWKRLGRPKQYIEPFCGSAAMLLAAPNPAALEVVCDGNGFIANFWRAVKHQPDKVAEWCDYPVSHIDLGARHRWLMEHRADLSALHDPDWAGSAKIAGWWLWGQCCWIGSGWCDWERASPPRDLCRHGRAGHRASDDDATSAGMGVQAIGKVPHAGNAGRGVLMTSAGQSAWNWLHKLAARLERVRIVHGDWSRCLNNHFGGAETAVFLDPPYRAYEKLYGVDAPVADAVEQWARDNADLRVAICGHVGDYSLPDWEAMPWSRGKHTYGGNKTTDAECIWFSPACEKVMREAKQEAFL